MKRAPVRSVALLAAPFVLRVAGRGSRRTAPDRCVRDVRESRRRARRLPARRHGATVRERHGGTSQFLGADAIRHTPANEDVRLHVGDSFDVTARKRQTEFHARFPTFEPSYEVVVSNAKKSTATLKLRVPAGGKTTLTYSTRTRCF